MEFKDPLDLNEGNDNNEGNPYWGQNVWGWKFSRIGLVLVAVFLALFIVRMCTHGDVGMQEDNSPWYEQETREN